MGEQPPRADRQARHVAEQLAGARFYIESLPDTERRIAELAAAGRPVWEIAQQCQVSEGAVARVIDGVVAAVTGRAIHPVETGGLGADTDPGVGGGYDELPIDDAQAQESQRE